MTQGVSFDIQGVVWSFSRIAIVAGGFFTFSGFFPNWCRNITT
jgi:hypothetical protein